MVRQKPEDKVKAQCLKRLDQWQSWGVVLDFDDVSALGKSCHRGRWVMKTVKGKRDIIALFKVEDKIWVYLIECKAKGGVWKVEQQEYAKRFAWINNVHYEVVFDAKQIDVILERITGRSDKLLKGMTL